MAWYDVVSWEAVIQKHALDNTYTAIIREITRYCTTCSNRDIQVILTEFAHVFEHMVPAEEKEQRVAVFVFLVKSILRNENYMSFKAYQYIQEMIEGIRGTGAYRQIVDIYRSYVKSYVTCHIPVWYAKALKEGKLPMYDIDSYRHSRYDAHMESVKLLRGMPVFVEWMLCVYNHSMDGDEYRELLHRTCSDSHRTIGDIRLLIRELHPGKNVEHLRMEEWRMLMRKMGYDTLIEFAIQSGIRGDVFAMSSIPLDELLAVIDGVREAYDNDDQLTVYVPEAREFGDIPDDDSEQYLLPMPEKFYTPKSLARGISRRPNITYEIYETVLRTLDWWVEPSPGEPSRMRYMCEMPTSPYGEIDAMFLGGVLSTQHEEVFRDFMDNKEKWGDTLFYCREHTRETRKWNNFCMALSTQVFLTLDDVKEMTMIDWDWEELSRNPSIATPENILSNMSLPWVWGRWGISASPGITPEFVINHWENGINFGVHPHIDDERGGTLSSNHSVVTPDLIDSLPDMTWSFGYHGLAQNHNMTLPWVLRTLRVRDWHIETILTTVKPDDDLAARAIQAWWRLVQVKRRCVWLAKEVEEWWYSPDCKPASKMRESMFWENHRECV